MAVNVCSDVTNGHEKKLNMYFIYCSWGGVEVERDSVCVFFGANVIAFVLMTDMPVNAGQTMGCYIRMGSNSDALCLISFFFMLAQRYAALDFVIVLEKVWIVEMAASG